MVVRRIRKADRFAELNAELTRRLQETSSSGTPVAGLETCVAETGIELPEQTRENTKIFERTDYVLLREVQEMYSQALIYLTGGNAEKAHRIHDRTPIAEYLKVARRVKELSRVTSVPLKSYIGINIKDFKYTLSLKNPRQGDLLKAYYVHLSGVFQGNAGTIAQITG